MATISNTPRPGYVWDSTDNVWYPIGTGPHSHADYITAGSAINPNIVDAKGDIIAATAADTVARLAVGSNNQVLTADSSTATGLKWATPAAGGMTLLASGSIAASATGFDLTSISDSYNELWLYITNYSVSTGADIRVRTNNNSGGDYSGEFVYNGAAGSFQGDSGFFIANSVNPTQSGQSAFIRFIDYANTTGWKLIDWAASTTDNVLRTGKGLTRSTSAINRISFVTAAGTFDSGTYKLYGVK